MPVAPRIDPSAGLAPLPGVRVPTDAPAEAFGGGPGASAPFKIGEQALQEARDREYQKSTDDKADSMWTQAVQKRNEYEQQAQARHGSDAFGVVNDYLPKYQADLDKIAESTNNPEAKHLFARMSRREYATLNDTLRSHIARESDQYHKAQYAGSLDTLKNDTTLHSGNPALVADNFRLAEAKIRSFGSDQGRPPEEIDAELSKWKSDTHIGIIDRMLDSNQPLAAESYLKAHQGEILATHLGPVTQAVKRDTVGYRADDAASELIARNRLTSGNGGDFDIAKISSGVDDITDKNLREQVRERVNAKVRQMHEAFNDTEGQLSGKLAAGQLTQTDLDQNRPNISNGFYFSTQQAMQTMKAGTTGTGTDYQKRQIETRLMNDWTNVFQGNVSTRAERLMKYRTEVLSVASQLDPDRFSTYLGLSDPKYVQKASPEQVSMLKSGWNWIKNHYSNFVPDGNPAAAMSRFISGAKGTDPAELPALAQKAVLPDTMNEHPELMGAGGVANNVASKSGIKQTFSGDTQLKATQKIAPPPTFKTGDEQTKGDVTYVRQEDGRWLPKPKP